MDRGLLSFSEVAILVAAAIPWLAAIVVAVVGLTLLRRLVRAGERIAQGIETKRREG